MEVPNYERNVVLLGDLLASATFTSQTGALLYAVGVDCRGVQIFEDLAQMPHLLIAGATGSGKSAAIS